MAKPEEGMASMIANLKTNTGKSLEQWVKIARAAKISKHLELVNYMKREHGFTHGYAALVARSTLQTASSFAESGDALIDEQYAGTKAALRPLYDALVAKISKFGGDVEFSAKKAYVSVRRKTQFAILQPSTATRLDVGIKLKGAAPSGRLEVAGSWNQMVTHRVRVESAKEIDAELVAWLKEAYSSAG
ncbi:MAG: DUF5655 domain-containing protein [Candidatus Eisenbacteria bacterium]